MPSLSKNVSNYLKGLLCVFENANCVSLSKISSCSHDSLTRVLKRKLSWQTLLESSILRTFGKLRDGWLIIDDTVISKKFADKIENLAWVFDSKIGKSILGLNIVVLVWSNGKITIPLSLKIYKPRSDKTKIDLAVELLKYAKFLKIKPKFVVFDSWYSADKLLRTIISYRWHFITRLKSNRLLNGIPLKKIQRNPYWIMEGKIKGELKVIVVKHGKRYFAASNLKSSKKEILDAYRDRWAIETIFRVLHSKLGIDQCSARKLTSQSAHFHLCLMTYIALEKEKYITGKSIYWIKRECSFNFKTAGNLLNKLNFQSA